MADVYEAHNSLCAQPSNMLVKLVAGTSYWALHRLRLHCGILPILLTMGVIGLHSLQIDFFSVTFHVAVLVRCFINFNFALRAAIEYVG